MVYAKLLQSVVWNGAATTAGLGYVGDATAFTAAGGIAGGTLGIIDVSTAVTAGANKARVDAWADIGTTDRRLLLHTLTWEQVLVGYLLLIFKTLTLGWNN